MKLLEFWATWCGSCKQQKKILEGFNDVPIEEVNIEEAKNQDLVIKYEIRSLPTLILVGEDGEALWKHTGTIPVSQIKEKIASLED